MKWKSFSEVGRVVTLISNDEMDAFEKDRDAEKTWGKIYKIPDKEADAALVDLDHREKAGYVRQKVDVHCKDGKVRNALVFIATPFNSDFVGPARLEDMAKQVHPIHYSIMYLIKEILDCKL